MEPTLPTQNPRQEELGAWFERIHRTNNIFVILGCFIPSLLTLIGVIMAGLAWLASFDSIGKSPLEGKFREFFGIEEPSKSSNPPTPNADSEQPLVSDQQTKQVDSQPGKHSPEQEADRTENVNPSTAKDNTPFPIQDPLAPENQAEDADVVIVSTMDVDTPPYYHPQHAIPKRRFRTIKLPYDGIRSHLGGRQIVTQIEVAEDGQADIEWTRYPPGTPSLIVDRIQSEIRKVSWHPARDDRGTAVQEKVLLAYQCRPGGCTELIPVIFLNEK